MKCNLRYDTVRTTSSTATQCSAKPPAHTSDPNFAIVDPSAT